MWPCFPRLMVIFLLVALYANCILFNILLYFHNFILTSNRCSTSILDLHRYCSDCESEICLTWCQESRNSGRLKRTRKSGPNLVAQNGHLYCVGPKRKSLLNLRCFFEKTSISYLEEKAEQITLWLAPEPMFLQFLNQLRNQKIRSEWVPNKMVYAKNKIWVTS